MSNSVRPHRWQPTRLPRPGILQARTLEWVGISFSNAWEWKVKVKSLSRIWLPATPWTAAYQAPPSMGFSRQEYWNGVPLPSPELDMTEPLLTTRTTHGFRLLAPTTFPAPIWRENLKTHLYGNYFLRYSEDGVEVKGMVSCDEK